MAHTTLARGADQAEGEDGEQIRPSPQKVGCLRDVLTHEAEKVLAPSPYATPSKLQRAKSNDADLTQKVILALGKQAVSVVGNQPR